MDWDELYPVTTVFVRRESVWTQTPKAEGKVKTEAEIGMTHP